MAQAALFTVIGGALVNLAKVTHMENSITSPGHVMVNFDNGKMALLNGSVETALVKIGGSRSDMDDRAPRS